MLETKFGDGLIFSKLYFMMLFGFPDLNLCKDSRKKAVKTLIFFEKSVSLLLRLCGHPTDFGIVFMF